MALVMLGVLVGLPVVAGDVNGFGEFSVNELDVDTPMQSYCLQSCSGASGASENSQ